MPRVFLSLCAANLICFLGAAAAGVFIWHFGQDRHILLAVFGLLLSCAIQVLAFTYFTVSGKVIVQAVHLGGLSPEPIFGVKSLKRSMTHLLGLVVASIVAVTATGAYAWRLGGSDWGHYAAVGAALLTHAFAWLSQYELVIRHHRLLSHTLAAYNARREETASLRARQ